MLLLCWVPGGSAPVHFAAGSWMFVTWDGPTRIYARSWILSRTGAAGRQTAYKSKGTLLTKKCMCFQVFSCAFYRSRILKKNFILYDIKSRPRKTLLCFHIG